MSENAERQKAYVADLQRRVDELWPSRLAKPDEFSSALNELNEAIMELNRLWEAEQR
jgi:hypothetical protein